MTDRDRIADILCKSFQTTNMCSKQCKQFNTKYCFHCYYTADYLLINGAVVLPFVAMVERFIKDGKFDRKRTKYNGRYAVVYQDKEKWGCPLIDITEQYYNSEKAEERIQELEGAISNDG